MMKPSVFFKNLILSLSSLPLMTLGMGCISPATAPSPLSSDATPQSVTVSAHSDQNQPSQNVPDSPIAEVKEIISKAKNEILLLCSAPEQSAQKSVALSLLQGLEDQAIYRLNSENILWNPDTERDIRLASQEPKSLCQSR